MTSTIEVTEGKALIELLLPQINQALDKLSTSDSAKVKAHQGLRALRSFASAFKLSYGAPSVSIDPEVGLADSGDLEADLSELFVLVGETAISAGRAWTLLIDEVQHLCHKDLGALISALHRINQKGLPVLFFGAGPPQVAARSCDVKSYAERLFNYSTLGVLEDVDAKGGIENDK